MIPNALRFEASKSPAWSMRWNLYASVSGQMGDATERVHGNLTVKLEMSYKSAVREQCRMSTAA